MRKFCIYVGLILLSVSSAIAQVDRSQYPAPGPAPVINIPEPQSFTLANGLKVFVVENHKLPRVTYSLILDRDPVLLGDKAGLTSVFGDVIMGGTTTFDKDALNEAIDRIGASINVSATSATASSLKKHNETLLDLFSDVLFHSAFSPDELERSKKQMISGLAAAKDDPASIASVVSSAVIYGKNHPYGESETEETVENIQISDVRNYYDTYFRPNIGYLAIVGDITLVEAKNLVEKHFADWERKDVPRHEWSAPAAPSSTHIAVVNRPASSQSVLSLEYTLDLQQNNPDVIGTSVVGRILGGGSSGRLFMNLREDKGYTYGAYGSLSPGRIAGSLSASANVGSGVTDSATTEFLYEFARLGQNTITQEELDLAKAAMAGSFGRSLEQPSTIASFAINTDRYDLPGDYYKNYLKNLDALTVNQVNQLAQKYVRADRLFITVVGRADDFADKLEQFGDVTFYTVEGEPEVKLEIEDASITAQGVIDRYIDAIGGREKLEAVKTFKMVSEAEVQGMTIQLEQIVDKNKGIALQNTKMGDQILSQVRIADGKVSVSAQGQVQELPAEAAGAYLTVLDIFPEIYYQSKGYQMTLDGMTTVEGQQAYTIKLTAPEGTQSVEYYSVETGLKLKSESAEAGESVNGPFKAYDGILMPESITVINQMIPFPVKAVAKDVSINKELTAEDLQ